MPFWEGFPTSTPSTLKLSQPWINHQVSIHHMCIFLSITQIYKFLIRWACHFTLKFNKVSSIHKPWEFLQDILPYLKEKKKKTKKSPSPTPPRSHDQSIIQTSWSNGFSLKTLLLSFPTNPANGCSVLNSTLKVLFFSSSSVPN